VDGTVHQGSSFDSRIGLRSASICYHRGIQLRTHHELRAAPIIAGRHIRKLSFGRRDDPVLQYLRRVMREARLAVDRNPKDLR